MPKRYLIVGQTRCQIAIVSCLSTVSTGPLEPEKVITETITTISTEERYDMKTFHGFVCISLI